MTLAAGLFMAALGLWAWRERAEGRRVLDDPDIPEHLKLSIREWAMAWPFALGCGVLLIVIGVVEALQ